MKIEAGMWALALLNILDEDSHTTDRHRKKVLQQMIDLFGSQLDVLASYHYFGPNSTQAQGAEAHMLAEFAEQGIPEEQAKTLFDEWKKGEGYEPDAD